MPKSKRPQSDKRAAKAAKAVQLAIRKDDPVKAPTVGKPVIIDPPDEAKPPVKPPEKRKPE